ncbi:MAG: C39 family peptidase [Lachnospiraceae bacterium]|nr:C39 family peptidase [Lachnospiraceae bacterium]
MHQLLPLTSLGISIGIFILLTLEIVVPAMNNSNFNANNYNSQKEYTSTNDNTIHSAKNPSSTNDNTIQSVNSNNDIHTSHSSNTSSIPDIEAEPDNTKNILTDITLNPNISYVEHCELSYVPLPKKRNREEALKEIKALAPHFPAFWIVYENEEKYPDEVLKSIASNPEMTHYAYHYLFADGSVTGGLTEDEQPEDYPLFLQWDIRWGYYPYGSASNLGASGCGPSCLAMAVYYLTGDTSVTPNSVADYSLEHNYYIEGVGTAWALLDTYPKQFDLRVTHLSITEKNLKKHLDKGNILICSVREGDFTAEGHFIVIYGYDEDGFKINDPKCIYRSRQTWSYDTIQDDIKRVWSIGEK